jgi:cellobiose phosphorylase
MAAEQSRVVRFVIGAAEGVEQARDTLERLVDPVTISVTHERAVAFWDRLLGRVEVQTPEPSMDLLLNGWLVSRFGPAYLRSGVGT